MDSTFAPSIAKMPGLNLYAPDKRHPGVAGSYLAACVTYASLFKSSPVDLTYTAGLDSAIAKHLQTVAWETVQEYFKPSAFDLLSVSSIHPSHRSTAGGAAFAEAGVVATQGWGGLSGRRICCYRRQKPIQQVSPSRIRIKFCILLFFTVVLGKIY